ncbi:MAG: hypothetical protein [Caudoviricetes sp.]|nr:MAG: hypothetical protein [Caudoviricetes sp.]
MVVPPPPLPCEGMATEGRRSRLGSGFLGGSYRGAGLFGGDRHLGAVLLEHLHHRHHGGGSSLQHLARGGVGGRLVGELLGVDDIELVRLVGHDVLGHSDSLLGWVVTIRLTAWRRRQAGCSWGWSRWPR